ncbi:hypothetical protein PLICRDRAFT_159289 [Plicaturopsis crispa FD-325 SS-3]|nr:hypothetical protein PLICRDRAFT_159289 [Plicaturopsis crispa FD-325 SS-3]
MVSTTPFLLATTLSLHGLRKRSLSPSGALTAFVVGYALLDIPLRAFGVSLLVFYAIGSIATKYGKKRKAALEEGHDDAGAGYRTSAQVLCNSLAAFAAGVLWSALHVPGSLATDYVSAKLGVAPQAYLGASWCPIDAGVTGGWSRALVFAMIGHFAACLGDTLASELGILYPTAPFLVTTWKRVPPGTNGAVSLGGTIASAVGGAIMGVVAAATIAYTGRCAGGEVEMLLWGAMSGYNGSFIDSFLGATLQRSRYSTSSKKILIDESAQEDTKDVEVISGWNVLSNNQVNLISSLVTSVVVGWLA